MNFHDDVSSVSLHKCCRIDGNDSASSAVRERLIEVEVLSIAGECMLTVNLADSMLGRELWRMILDKTPSRPGLQLVVSHTSKLVLHESLQQQGLGDQRAQVSATYMPVNLHAAWRFAHGHSIEDAEFSLTGITDVTNVSDDMPALLRKLPKSLRTLTLISRNSSHEIASRPPKFDFWLVLRTELGQHDMARRPSSLDFCLVLRSEPGQRDMATSPSPFDFR